MPRLDLATALDTRGRRAGDPARVILGWVTDTAASSVTVQLADGSRATAPVLRSYASPQVDDVVLLLRSAGSLYCLGAFNAGPAAPPTGTTDPEPPRDQTTTQTFRPLSTGTWRGDGWRTDTTNLLQGDPSGEGLNYGAAYYGAAPSSLGIDPATATGTLRIRRNTGGPAGAQTPILHLLAEEERPDVQPATVDTVIGPALGVNDEATVNLPATWVAALLSGTAGGIGTGIPAAAPYLALAGSSAWAPAFELAITWET